MIGGFTLRGNVGGLSQADGAARGWEEDPGGDDGEAAVRGSEGGGGGGGGWEGEEGGRGRRRRWRSRWEGRVGGVWLCGCVRVNDGWVGACVPDVGVVVGGTRGSWANTAGEFA
jgi:hypothetical protein